MHARDDRIRLNRWARAADGELGDWLEGLGADYAGCAVDDHGTRALAWVFPRGRLGATRRRRRELLVRALGGDPDRWELIYRETGVARVRGTVCSYASTSTRATLTELRPGAARLVDAGLPHLPSPVDTCGHSYPDPRLLPGLAVAAAAILLLAAMLANAATAWLLAGSLGLLLAASGWLAVRAARHALGLPRGRGLA